MVILLLKIKSSTVKSTKGICFFFFSPKFPRATMLSCHLSRTCVDINGARFAGTIFICQQQRMESLLLLFPSSPSLEHVSPSTLIASIIHHRTQYLCSAKGLRLVDHANMFY